MTDLMIHIPADWLTQVFLTLRRGVTEDAHALATELQPFTEKPGQRVPVPSTTLLRAEQALLRARSTPGKQTARMGSARTSGITGTAPRSTAAVHPVGPPGLRSPGRAGPGRAAVNRSSGGHPGGGPDPGGRCTGRVAIGRGCARRGAEGLGPGAGGGSAGRRSGGTALAAGRRARTGQEGVDHFPGTAITAALVIWLRL